MRLTLPRLHSARSLLATPSQVASLIISTAHASRCPCHQCTSPSPVQAQHSLLGGLRRMGSSIVEKEYAFEVAASNIRFGEGVTKEVGMDFANLKAKHVGVFTDPTVAKLPVMKVVAKSLADNGVHFTIFDQCKVEPTDDSWREAIAWSRQQGITEFLAVGGGSVIDTAKAANLFTVEKDADLFDYINAPVGKGLPVRSTLRPLIAIPTTAGTGSETTGSAIVDIPSLRFKTGIASRALKPMLGIVDPRNTETCPRNVHLSSGLDTLFHALESYTALPYNERVPRPKNPIERPAYQGRNPISDVFSTWALKTVIDYLPRVLRDPTDAHAREQMLLASTFAGIGFGNAGVHLSHGLSYPFSSQNKNGPKYRQKGYEVETPLIPHGISVALSGPAVFQFTAPSSPDRHREILRVFGADGDNLSVDDGSLGLKMRETLIGFLEGLGEMPKGLEAVGYKESDVDSLVEGVLPQKRVLSLAPNLAEVEGQGREQLESIIRSSLVW